MLSVTRRIMRTLFSHNVYERSVEINEQLSRSNSLNAFLLSVELSELGFSPRIGVCMPGNWT